MNNLDKQLSKLPKRREPMTKEMQTQKNRIKPKKESTFGKKPSKGSFGKKNYDWNRKGNNLKPKVKKNDIIDNKYSKWLGEQACVVTGIYAKRGIGANDMHCHHIYGRNGGRNDYEQVPLIGYVHTWGNNSYHSTTKEDFIKAHGLIVEDLMEFFEDMVKHFNEKYIEEGNKIHQND